MHGPSAGPRDLTATRAGRSSRRGHTSRRAPRHGRVVTHSARVGGDRARDAVSEGRGGAKWQMAVTLALMLGSEPNQGWCAVRRGHADDAAAWFVSFGRAGGGRRRSRVTSRVAVLGRGPRSKRKFRAEMALLAEVRRGGAFV